MADRYATGRGWGPGFLDMIGLIDAEPLDDIREDWAYLGNLNLTDAELLKLLKDHYYTPDPPFAGNELGLFDAKDMYNDYVDAVKLLKTKPEAPELQTYLDSARDEASALYSSMYDELAQLAEERKNSYGTELANISNMYGSLRSNLISQQYQQNAQLMDTLQSNMDRNRRNALEAGASAGIRIADNINTLLTVQNKQSATSMETANQLSQMMINQRNAEASARNSYNDYMTQNTMNRQNLKREEESYARDLANTNYTAARDSYVNKMTEYDKKAAYNPMYNSVYGKYGGN